MKSYTTAVPISLLSAIFFAAALVFPFIRSTTAQARANSAGAQRQAMENLSFLAGHWSGPVTITAGPSESLHLTQTEDVQYKLDGLVLLIEGKSTGADGKAEFSALATIAYDDSTHSYHFRAYNNGHYVDTELSVTGKGFSWGFTASPAHIVNTMRLTDKGEWAEVTETTLGGNPPLRSVDMLLRKSQ